MADPRLIDLSADLPPTAAGEGEDAAAFYFDPADADSWLVAERILTTLGVPAAWTPVDLRAKEGTRSGEAERVERTATERGLLDFRPPEAWVLGDDLHSRAALLAATYAKQAGKTVAFTLALMRQCWCAGRDVRDVDTILLAGAAAEIHPRALEKALGLRSLELELDRATAEAISLGVATVPSVRIRRRIFVGDGRLEDAAEAAR